METKHGITISTTTGCTRNTTATSVNEFRVQVAIPYLDALVSNIKSRFSDDVVKVVTSASIFNPTILPENEAQLPNYGTTPLTTLADFYGKEAVVEFEGTSPAIIKREELFSEWPIFKRAFFHEKKGMMISSNAQDPKAPSMQEIKVEMESNYSVIFPEIFKIMNILLVIPVGTASVERSFSQMKTIKTRLCNRLADTTLARLMRIAIEGPELSDADFDKILEVFGEQNRRLKF